MSLPVRLVDVAEGNGDLVVSAAGVAETERLVCFVDTDAGGGGGAVTGWTLLDSDGSGADSGFCYAHDELGPGSGSHTFNIAGGADGAAMLIAVDGSPDVDDTAASTGTGTSMVAGSVTAGAGPDRELVVWWKTWSHVDETTAAITAPDSMTVVEGADNVASGAGWGRRTIATETVGAGATGTRTATSDPANRWVALSVVLSGTDPDGGQQVDLTAAADAVADAAVDVVRVRAVTAVTDTAADAAGVVARVRVAVASASASTDAVGALTARRNLAGASSNAGSAAGALQRVRHLAGTAAAAAAGDGHLATVRALAGTADAAADGRGALATGPSSLPPHDLLLVPAELGLLLVPADPGLIVVPAEPGLLEVV